LGQNRPAQIRIRGAAPHGVGSGGGQIPVSESCKAMGEAA
jgi:hypothetical protein